MPIPPCKHSFTTAGCCEYRRAVVSNAVDSNAATMKAAFERMGIDRYFSFFITSNEIGYKNRMNGFSPPSRRR